MTFPIDFHRHPKLKRLPVEVRWTFVEMNGEARIADNDGVFTHEDAEFEWPIDHLERLVSSHPTRPLVVKTDTHYVIREFPEHQETKASREERRAKNAANGAKGGRPRKNPPGTQQKPSGLRVGTDSQANETQQKAESESESEDYYSPLESQSSSNRASVSTDSFEISEHTRASAARKGVDLQGIAVALNGIGIRVDAYGAMSLANHLLEKAKSFPSAPQRYVLGCITQSPHEIAKYLHDSGLAA
ncbi:hypothetical protein [Microbacterium trichothecenolyticum]|nr:hypothetical protein [Microbacterium trichothecenolyticum]